MSITKTPLEEVISVVYPIQRRRIVVHFRNVKRTLMKMFRLDRWELDTFLFKLQKDTNDSQFNAIYFSSCGARPGSRLNYISWAGKGEKATFMNSYCFISIDNRNENVKSILEENK